MNWRRRCSAWADEWGPASIAARKAAGVVLRSCAAWEMAEV
jgi:hypothetical protein